MSLDGAVDGMQEPVAISSADVDLACRLILGRGATVDETRLLGVAPDRSALLAALLALSDFREVVLPALRARSGLVERDFHARVDHQISAWAASFFGLDPAIAAEGGHPRTGGALLAACLTTPVLQEPLDALYAAGTAEGLASAAAALSPHSRVPVRPGPAGTSTTDLTNCYRLFLGREPESEQVVHARPDVPAVEAALDFVLSQEFREKVVTPALDGHMASDAKPEESVRHWAAETFELAVPGYRTTIGLLASVLRQPWIAARLQQRQPYWPAGPLAAALTRVDTALAEDAFAGAASGIELLRITGMRKLAGEGLLGCAGADACIEFRLKGSAAAADLVALRLGGFAPDGGAAALFLDYGDGYSEAASLTLGAVEGHASEVVIAAARKLRALRWRPAERAATLSLTLLAARPVTVDEVIARVHRDPATAADAVKSMVALASGDPSAGIAISLSRLLSPRLLQGYEAWLHLNEPDDRRLWTEQLRSLRERPLISIVTPTYNTDVALLGEMIESVRAQVYPHWELCIADDASSDPEFVRVLRRHAERDERIKLVVRPVNGHISAASNSALELATGEWTVLLDHDDLLRPNALLAIAREVGAHPDVQLIYSDEDKIEGAVRSSPFFKPDYAPELFLAQNYFNHLTAHRTANIRAVGGWREGFEGSQDYDLILRILERIAPEQVRHIPEILYHWRIVEGSTALDVGEKTYAFDAGLRALGEHLDRTRPGACVEAIDGVPYYRVRPPLPERLPSVSLIIPTRDKAEILEVAVRSILDRSSYADYEIIIVDNGSQEPQTFALFETLLADPRVRVLPYAGSFNYPALNNYAARLAKGEIIGLVNNDIEVLTPDWIEEMVSWAVQDGIGCVGAKLLYPDMTVQHAGVVIGIGGVAGHGHKYARRSDPGYFGRLQIHSNVSAVTAACLLVRRELFEAVRGLDERLAVAFNDVDFCLRVRELGYRHVFTPFAELIHHESKSRGVEDTPEKVRRFSAEVDFMMKHWDGKLDEDPMYSPNLSYDTDDFALGRSRRVRQPG